LPDPILRGKSLPLKEIDSKAREMIDEMIRIMYAYKGIGLAAPQIGILFRVIVVDTEQGSIPIINPEILESDGEDTAEEGCLSVPEVSVNVIRGSKILVRGIDLNEKEIEFEVSGLLARVFQHEIDHLEGKLIIDNLPGLK
jgi:peptide deformylase